jgi:hypothetical protein
MKTRQSATKGAGLVAAACFALSAWAQNDSKTDVTNEQKPAIVQAPIHATTYTQPITSAVIPVRKTPSTAISPWYTEIVKMTKAGIGPQALLAYIDSAGTFNLGADQIIHLHDLGLPNGLITAMIQHDADLSSGVMPLPVTAVPSATTKLAAALKTPSSTTNAAPVATVVRPVTKAPEVAAAGEPPPPEIAIEEDLEANYPELFDYPPTTPPEPAGFSPVRRPYPVPLTDPIIMVRAPERMPNVISISMH